MTQQHTNAPEDPKAAQHPSPTVERVELVDYVNIKYITADAQFSLSPGGLLLMRFEDKDYKGVTLHRAFPFGIEDRYICVKDKENKEIGMISKLSDFPKDTEKLLREQMKLRYFAPTILSITTVKEDFGYLLWSVETDLGPMMFTTQTTSNVIVPVGESHYLVIDLDGNRFEIPDLKKLSPKDVYKIEMYL